jgi:hypothetical protein
MPRRRYQLPKVLQSDEDRMPTDTVCTILVRQSTAGQAERHTHSSEVHPDVLIAQARRMGFERTLVCDDDMGIGAFSTTIEDRPALRRWMYELLPSGESKVVMVSMEDRLFRDEDEIQHNRFIKLVKEYGGWVICGPRVYDFRKQADQDMFRDKCRYAKEYIIHHIKERLHPAIQRSAMAGRYAGGRVPWGYVVDYEPRSETYKYHIVYPPHAPLVHEHIFRYFASLAHPTAIQVARHWSREGLLFPFYETWVEPSIVRYTDRLCERDDQRGGYPLSLRQTNSLLSNVIYLGYRERAGEIALDDSGLPRVCHPPLVDPDLFWYCFDYIYAERPIWAPPRVGPSPRRFIVKQSPHDGKPPGERFLAYGKVRCAKHEQRLSLQNDNGRVRLHCNAGDTWRRGYEAYDCVSPGVNKLEPVICQAFLDHLALDEHDVAELARLLEQRLSQRDMREAALRRQISEATSRYEYALNASLRPENRAIAADLMARAVEAKEEATRSQIQLMELQQRQTISGQAWAMAHQLTRVVERVKATFSEWSRIAQSQVIGLALEDAVVGYVNRYTLGLWMKWCGGRESRERVVMSNGKYIEWTEEDQMMVKEWYERLTWTALLQMFPGRTRTSIEHIAGHLHLDRRGKGPFSDEVPTVCPLIDRPVIDVENSMEKYGFSLDFAPAVLTGQSSRRGPRTVAK